MPSAQMIFDVIARDGASGSFRRMAAEADGAGRSFDRLGKAAAGVTVLFAAFAVNAAAKFESAMTRISTQAGVPIGQIKALGDSLLKLAPQVGTGPEALATSLYHVESAFRTTGISAGKAIDIVQQAAKLSKIGNADLESTTQAIIGVLSSGIKGVKDATDAAAQLNQLVGAGDTTLSAVVKSVATGILPTAAALGLTFKDVSAALATLTDNATPADEAATRLRTTFSLIEKPSKQAVGALESIHLSTVSLAEDFRKPNGLLVAMEDLKTHLNQVYPLSKSTKLSTDEIAASTNSYTNSLLQQGVTQKEAIDLGKKYSDSLKAGGSAATLQAQTILQAFGGAKSGATFLTLYEELTRLQSKYQDFGTSAQAANKFQEAWANQQQTFKQKLDDLKASWDVFLIKAGNAILPVLKSITDYLSQHPGLLHDAALGVLAFAGAWATLKVANLIGSLGTLAGKIINIGTVSRTAAGDVAALDIAAAGGRGGGAAGSVEALGGAFAKSGLLLGGAVAVGIGALALDIHQIITDGQVKHLPALDAVAGAIYAGGLTGKQGTSIVQSSLSGVSSGDNRKESQLDYLKRVLGSAQAKNVDVVSPLDFSLKGLFKTIQTGTQTDLTGFLAGLREVGFQLKGSPNTIATVSNYLQGLFSRYNSGRDAAKQAGAAVQAYFLALRQAKGAILGTSTDVGFLSKQLGISRDAAARVAESNAVYDFTLKNVGARISTFNQSLTDNTVAAKSNRSSLAATVLEVQTHAAAVLKQTGNLQVSDAVFKTGIDTIKRNAEAVGVNKGQIDGLIDSLHLMPPVTTSDVRVTGIATANQQVELFLEALARIPFQRQVDLTVGPVSPALIANATAGGPGGHQADGGIYPHGVPGGVVQWAEAGGESFIPHDPAKRQRALDIWTKTGRVLGVTGMANGGISAGGLTAASTAAQTANYLKALATATNNLVGKLTTYVTNQQQYRNTVQGQLANGNTFNDILGQSGNASDIKTLLRSKLSALKAFVGKIATLKKTGWPDAIIRDIASDGVDVGSQYADLLLHASKTDKASITGLSSELTGGQLAGANLTAALTGGTAGLTNRSALAVIESAAFTPGANIGKLVAQAARTQVVYNVMPVANQHINSPVDLKTQLGAATFLIQSGGTF